MTATPREPQAVPQRAAVRLDPIAEARVEGILRGVAAIVLGELVLLVLLTWFWSIGL
jgi:hypothetical protein